MGGSANLRSIDACTTRLRLVLGDVATVDRAGLTALGSRGVLDLGNGGLQVVLGPIADLVAGEMRAAANVPPVAVAAVAATPLAEPRVRLALDALVRALGGADNIGSSRTYPGRFRAELRDPELVDRAGLDAAAPFGWAWIGDRLIHVLV